ncbi:AIPR family protein [Arthrobacter sp. ISL-69]|uniref:AIPR family protein n=1 Tax=Arthrobacter sp. ISL-69 TaxID=2819113 RepID=UPI001BEA52A2|nr:AIPR family protein [Arthrobacter sp. ISL-69]MBT2534856.1 AIPR family protein [Arthrobacter sp. ISL-69]
MATLDRITESLLNSFIDQEQLQHLKTHEAFEHFAAFSVIAPKLHESLATDDVAVGHGSTPGIDSLAIVTNGALISSPDELDELTKSGSSIDVDFYFIQSKTSGKFEGARMADFADEVRSFFQSNDVHASLQEAKELTTKLLSLGMRLKRNPTCHMYYVTPGRWNDDPYLQKKIATSVERLEDTNMFSKVLFTPVGANQLQDMYRAAHSKTEVNFTFSSKVTLPKIEGVQQSYIGVLPGSQFLQIIRDVDGDLRRGIFEDNVRDFQGSSNPVNAKIRTSIAKSGDRFSVLNNGVTIVAKAATVLGDEFTLEDFQIVNGCQTSNVLFEARESLSDVTIPVRIIVTQDDSIATQITDATNSQSQVKTEDLYSLLQFQRKLEAFFATYSEPERLYYERRSQQYRAISSTPRSRVVTRAQLVKSFASVFLDEPNRASRYYSTLYSVLGERLFNDDHELESYYAAAVALFRSEALFRSGVLKNDLKPVRYHLLQAVRHLVAGNKLEPFNSAAQKKTAASFAALLWNPTHSELIFAAAANVVVDASDGNELTRDFSKLATFTKRVAEEAATARALLQSESWILT